VLEWLKTQEDEGQINLVYFDESGFSLKPVVPYGWQRVGETFCIPCQHSKRLNVLGFMSRDSDLFYHTVEGAVDTKTVIDAFDDFTQHYYDQQFKYSKKLCFVVLDNASMHRSADFQAKQEDWLLRGVCLHFIPPYCPELNLIEILWRKIKYEWLPMGAYRSTFANFQDNVKKVLAQVGEQGKRMNNF